MHLLSVPYVLAALTHGAEPHRFCFGRSPVALALQTTPAARRAADLLQQAQALRLFAPLEHDPARSLVHTLSQRVFAALSDEHQGRWWVHFSERRAGRKRRQLQVEHLLPRSDTPISMVSGMCLFGASSLRFSSSEGRVLHLHELGQMPSGVTITRLHIEQDYHLYEMETLLRFATFCRAVLHPDRQFRLLFHLPRLEYWLYLWPAYQQHQLSADLLVQWFEQVDRRTRRLQLLVQHAFAGMQIQFLTPLAATEPLLRHAVAHHPHILFPAVRDTLQLDPCWQSLLRTHEAATSGAPLAVEDLIHLSYICGYAQAFRSSSGFCLLLENPEEEPILARTIRCLAPLDTHLLGIYLHPGLLVPRGGSLHPNHLLFWCANACGQEPIQAALSRRFFQLFGQHLSSEHEGCGSA